MNELCESSEHAYFLANADLFIDSIKRQDREQRRASLAIMASRLIHAAEFARGICSDKPLADHFRAALQAFYDLYDSEVGVAAPSGFDDGGTQRVLVRGCLAVRAALMEDLPLARCILFSHHELKCSSPQCDQDVELRCKRCGGYAVPYEHHRVWQPMRNVEAHPPHRENTSDDNSGV